MDEGGRDFDVSLARAGANDLLEGFIVRGAAVGIAGAVLLDGADEDGSGPQHLGPTDGCGQKVGIAKRHIGDGNRLANRGVLRCAGNGDGGVGERRAADAPEDIDLEMEKVAEIKGCSDLAGALQLTAFGALSVAEVEGIGLVVARRKSRAYSGS